jgi:hypothetical protein
MGSPGDRIPIAGHGRTLTTGNTSCPGPCQMSQRAIHPDGIDIAHQAHGGGRRPDRLGVGVKLAYRCMPHLRAVWVSTVRKATLSMSRPMMITIMRPANTYAVSS